MNLKLFIKQLLPYRLVANRNKKLRELDLVNIDIEKKEDIPQTESLFTNYITTIGFGYSGHSAVLDLLKEYSNTLEFCDKYFRHYEFDLLRHSGGLYDIENHVESNNHFLNDALLHRTISLFRYFKPLQYNQKALDVSSRFVSNLIDMKISGLTTLSFNPHLISTEEPNREILYLKKCTRERFREISRQYLNTLFNCFYEDNKDTLVINHMFTDGDLDMVKIHQYLPDVKIIVMYRDPRDVYAQAIINKVQWIPHCHVDDFIKWYNISVEKFNPNSNEYLSISFGELICEYEETVRRIENYVGLDPNFHVNKRMYLDPGKSIKNIGLWMNIPNIEDDIKLIEKKLSKFLYTKHDEGRSK